MPFIHNTASKNELPLSSSRLIARFLLVACLAMGGAGGVTAADTAVPRLKVSHALSTSALAGHEAQAGLWQRIRAGFSLPESDPVLTRRHEAWFSDHSAYLSRGVERSRPYLYYIAEEVEKRGMPMEIALLPMIESAYNPQALSPMKAMGLWQFIPSTGSLYGLKRNAWFDGRRDVVSATRAALDYLQTLHAMFGDWELALAAYNCGEGCVARAQSRRQGKTTDYASLRLPTETRHYVPKLVALRNIVLDPRRFGISLEMVANEPYFMQVALQHPMEARQAARLADMKLDDFLALNPGFQRRVIHTDSHNVLLLPTERLEVFQFNLHRQGVDAHSLQAYQARRGESVIKIAEKFGVTLAWLKEHNPLRLHKGNVAQAQTLLVPAKTGVSSKPETRVLALARRPAMRIHTVRKGDTLERVAKHYKVQVTELRRWNESSEPLRPGDTLEVPISG
ncbi:MAG: transglycosylase SLT domain-containing protein [Thiobacillus sp.]|nr:transglycosylase SLT domain-containing protein [Thiobacillus sp.]